jgi:hypothetical protein
MSFKEKSRQIRFGIIGMVALPLLYVFSLIFSIGSDFFYGPQFGGFLISYIQMISFHLWGWPFPTIATIVFLGLEGYFLGRLIGWSMDVIMGNIQ